MCWWIKRIPYITSQFSCQTVSLLLISCLVAIISTTLSVKPVSVKTNKKRRVLVTPTVLVSSCLGEWWQNCANMFFHRGVDGRAASETGLRSDWGGFFKRKNKRKICAISGSRVKWEEVGLFDGAEAALRSLCLLPLGQTQPLLLMIISHHPSKTRNLSIGQHPHAY